MRLELTHVADISSPQQESADESKTTSMTAQVPLFPDFLLSFINKHRKSTSSSWDQAQSPMNRAPTKIDPDNGPVY